MHRTYSWTAAALMCGIVIVLFEACGGATTAEAQKPAGVGGASARTAAARGLDRCALLTDKEVEEAIGPHEAGSIGSMYGVQGCTWTSTTVQKVSAFPNGWRDSIEVTVFDEDKELWARDQAQGDPIAGFLDGARYDTSYGTLWFNCGRDRFCALRARTNASAKREQIARQLAQAVDKRLR